MGRRMRRRLVGQRDYPIDRRSRQRRDPRRPGLVAGQPCDPLVHEARLPAPDHRLVLAEETGNGVGALAICRQQDDLGARDVPLRAVALPYDRLQSRAIGRPHRYGYSLCASRSVSQNDVARICNWESLGLRHQIGRSVVRVLALFGGPM